MSARRRVATIVEARGDKPFKDLTDFARRINPRAVNKRVLESLASSGAFDTLESNRASAHAGVDAMLGAAQRSHEAVSVGQNDMFGGPSSVEKLPIPAAEPWLAADRLRREYEAIGFFLSGHPLDEYAAVLQRLKLQSWTEFSRSVKSGATAGRVAATVVSRQERRTKTGNKMGIFGLSDPSGAYEAIMFAEGLQQFRDQLEPGAAVLLFLTAEAQGDEIRARIQSVEPLDQAASKLQKALRVLVRDEKPLESISRRLEMKGDGEVTMVAQLPDGTEVDIRLPGRFKLSPQIAGAIKAVPGVLDVQMM